MAVTQQLARVPADHLAACRLPPAACGQSAGRSLQDTLADTTGGLERRSTLASAAGRHPGAGLDAVSGRPGMRAGRSRRGPFARSPRQATDGDTTIDLGFPEFEAQKAKLLGQETTPRSCLHRAPTAVGVFPGGAQELTPRGVPRQATSWRRRH